jgi:hypothetical protein
MDPRAWILSKFVVEVDRISPLLFYADTILSLENDQPRWSLLLEKGHFMLFFSTKDRPGQ